MTLLKTWVRMITRFVLYAGGILGALCATSSITAAYADTSYRTLSRVQTNLDYIVRQFKGVSVGIMVESLSTGKILYQYHPDRQLIPASTLKLFTGIAALDYLGPNFQFKTRLLKESQAKIIHGTLQGDLYIQFSGDPNLTLTDLKEMLATLREQKIHSIQGNVVIDDTALDRSTWPPGRVVDDKIFCYAAPVTATIINRNCFSVSVKPSKSSKHPTVVKSNRHLGIKIDNQATTQRLKKKAHYFLDFKPNPQNKDNHYTLRGYLSPKVGPLSFAVALQNPNLATYNILSGLLRSQSIHYNKMVYGRTTPTAKTLAENSSPELAFLVKNMLKKSDNLIADSLLKKLGGLYFSTQGSWKTGRNAIQAILATRAHVNFNDVVMVDGSGLSRNNLVSARVFIQLLKYAYHQLPESDLFFESLPNSGQDGTLKNRLGGPVLGRIHAKTGSMHGISSLAGYIRTVNHQTLAFAILVNDVIPGRNNQGGYRLLENRICEFLAKNTL